MASLRTELDSALGTQNEERSAAECAEKHVIERLRAAQVATEVLQAERERAHRAMLAAASATNLSLRVMSARLSKEGGHDAGNGDDSIHEASLPEVQAQLRSATEEVAHWRRGVEDLQELQDVVVVEAQLPGEATRRRSGRTLVMHYEPWDAATDSLGSIRAILPRMYDTSRTAVGMASDRFHEMTHDYLPPPLGQRSSLFESDIASSDLATSDLASSDSCSSMPTSPYLLRSATRTCAQTGVHEILYEPYEPLHVNFQLACGSSSLAPDGVPDDAAFIPDAAPGSLDASQTVSTPEISVANHGSDAVDASRASCATADATGEEGAVSCAIRESTEVAASTEAARHLTKASSHIAGVFLPEPSLLDVPSIQKATPLCQDGFPSTHRWLYAEEIASPVPTGAPGDEPCACVSSAPCTLSLVSHMPMTTCSYAQSSLADAAAPRWSELNVAPGPLGQQSFHPVPAATELSSHASEGIAATGVGATEVEAFFAKRGGSFHPDNFTACSGSKACWDRTLDERARPHGLDLDESKLRLFVDSIMDAIPAVIRDVEQRAFPERLQLQAQHSGASEVQTAKWQGAASKGAGLHEIRPKLEESDVEKDQGDKYKELSKPLLDYAEDTQGKNAVEDVIQNLGMKISRAIIAERQRATRTAESEENILHIPKETPFNLYQDYYKKLYVGRIITSDEYDDLSLEMLQQNRVLKVIGKKMTRKALTTIKAIAMADTNQKTVQQMRRRKAFVRYVKMGLIEDAATNRIRLAKLLCYKYGSDETPSRVIAKQTDKKAITTPTQITAFLEDYQIIGIVGAHSTEKAVRTSPFIEQCNKRTDNSIHRDTENAPS